MLFAAPCPGGVINTTIPNIRSSHIVNLGDGIPAVFILPTGYYFQNTDSLDVHISYRVKIADGETAVTGQTGGQLGGFFGAWGEKFRNMTWKVDPDTGHTSMNGTIPAWPEYFITLPEAYIVSISTKALNSDCQGGFVSASFTVTSDQGSDLIEILPTISTVVSSGAVGMTLISGGSASMVDAQALAIFSFMSCADIVNKQAGPLRYFLSPFVDFGLHAMLGGNLAIILLVALLQLAVSKYLRKSRRIDRFSSFAATRFPKYTYIIAGFLHQGIAFASFVSIRTAFTQESGIGYYHLVSGVLGTLYVIAFPIVVRQGISRFARVSFVKYWQFKKKSPLVRWLYPLGYWHPLPQRQTFGSMFCNQKGKYIFWGTIQMTTIVIITAISAVQPPAHLCHVQYICMGTVLFLAALIAAVKNPMRSPFQTVLLVASMSCLGSIMMTSAAHHLRRSATTSSYLAYLSLLQMMIMLVALLYNTIIFYYETKVWSSLVTPRRNDLEDILDIDLEVEEAKDDEIAAIIRQLRNVEDPFVEEGQMVTVLTTGGGKSKREMLDHQSSSSNDDDDARLASLLGQASPQRAVNAANSDQENPLLVLPAISLPMSRTREAVATKDKTDDEEVHKHGLVAIRTGKLPDKTHLQGQPALAAPPPAQAARRAVTKEDYDSL